MDKSEQFFRSLLSVRHTGAEWYVLAPVAVSMILLAMVVAIAAARPWIRRKPMEVIRHV